MRSPGAPRVDGRARLPTCLVEARVTLVGSSDPCGLALQLDEGRRHGGDRGRLAAGAGTGDIAVLSGSESRTEAGGPWPVRAALLQPGSLGPRRLLASSLPTPSCRPRIFYVDSE